MTQWANRAIRPDCHLAGGRRGPKLEPGQCRPPAGHFADGDNVTLTLKKITSV
jgi:hypothetical protein